MKPIKSKFHYISLELTYGSTINKAIEETKRDYKIPHALKKNKGN